MKTLIKTKLIDPTHIEVRDYELGQDLRLIHCTAQDYKKCDHLKEEFMILTKSAQKKGKVINTQQSKFYPYKYYKIYKFLWKPSKMIVETETINIPIEAKLRLRDIFKQKVGDRN